MASTASETSSGRIPYDYAVLDCFPTQIRLIEFLRGTYLERTEKFRAQRAAGSSAIMHAEGTDWRFDD